MECGRATVTEARPHKPSIRCLAAGAARRVGRRTVQVTVQPNGNDSGLVLQIAMRRPIARLVCSTQVVLLRSEAVEDSGENLEAFYSAGEPNRAFFLLEDALSLQELRTPRSGDDRFLFVE